jgi:hypothetical protein
MLIPKNLSTYSPIKNEIKRIIPTFTAAHIEILDRSFLVSSCVSPTKIGIEPRGLITENNAANT